MTTHELALLERIRSRPDILAGLPIIVGPAKRILSAGEAHGSQDIMPVLGILQQLSIGKTPAQIMAEVKWLTADDIEACKLWWRKMQDIDTRADGERVDVRALPNGYHDTTEEWLQETTKDMQ
jgi:uncharacterized protein (DUF433 family)